jgi:ribose 5-phosphate isomerase B
VRIGHRHLDRGQSQSRRRCALVSEPLSAALAREHNDANVIAMGARLIGIDMAKACVTAFLTTEFAGGRHQRRVDKLSHPERSPA